MKYNFELETLKDELKETQKEYRQLLDQEGTQKNCTQCLQTLEHIEFLKNAIRIMEQ